MPSEYESGQSNLNALLEWWKSHSSERNEATTRLQMIDRLFLECLGWSRDDIVSEESHDGEYADYTFRAPRRILIVEAKKVDNAFELPAGKTRLEYSLPTLLHDYHNLKAAIEQVSSYCQERGVPFGAVCNGHQIVAFVANRTDGSPPLSGRALVFPSLSFMAMHFLDLWQALSKPGIEGKYLYARLVGSAVPDIPAKLSATIGGYPGVQNRNPFQVDLQLVSDVVLEDVAKARELEATFLEECYSRSGALSQYSLLSKQILQARYSALFESNSPGPVTIPATTKSGISPELLADSLSRRPILLIGDVGVGKTTFIRYLLKVDAAALFANAITLYIDLGSQATLTTNLHTFVPDEIERQLRDDYGLDIEERNFVRGVYHLELERFSKGIYGDLRTSNPNLYLEKEIEFLEQKFTNREQFLKDALAHISKGHRKQIVIFLDNADQRSDDTQQQAFLIAQEMADRWPATVFVALRPETYHRSLQSGALSGYHPKAFTISPPRIDRVLEKRLQFALKICRGEIPLQALTGDTAVNLSSLYSVVKIFLSSLQYSEALGESIDNIANGNVRLALDLVKGFFGSGHVNTQKIIERYEETGSYFVPLHEFLRAVIFGDDRYFDPDRSPVVNVFDVNYADPKEHFIVPLLINTLESASSADGGFVETSQVYERLQGFAFTPEQIDMALIRCHKKKLVETSARRVPVSGQPMPDSLRATNVGVYHIKRLCQMFTYVDAVIVDTPIFDTNIRHDIRDTAYIDERLARSRLFRRYLDEQWLQLNSVETTFDWTIASAALEQDITRIESRLARR